MLQHQISHSPARLGLTSPTSSSSPSLPNPNTKFAAAASASHQQPHHHPNLPSSAAAAAAPATSSTLLSLLPPLPRAQSLLLQMSSLASKLFDVSPNRALWLSSFRGSLPTFLSSPPQSAQSHVVLPDPPPSSTKEILSLFTSLQTQLFKAVAELQEILDLQDAKHKLTREIRSKDSALLSFANRLKDAEHVLDILVDDYADYRRPKRSRSASAAEEEDGDDDLGSSTTVASRLNLSDIVSYAHRISYTTFAPPDFGAGQAPLRGALPPAPQDEQMRASQLYSVDDIQLPKSAVQDDHKESISIVEPPAIPDVPAIPGLPGNIIIPSGWKPGMPVELPTDLPVPPPGWKPGDPITLPPIDTLPVRRPEEPQLQPVGPPGLHKEPETIQVRHVDLELPDNFDDSSDYSSDDASSEDDE
ncbi:hypothetical protein BT93_J2057 [Corymbia citriodora subsp. variegata]|nr:hypothetical protein BT93_J2057 [Corymbia citriodora subsp. variegata]